MDLLQNFHHILDHIHCLNVCGLNGNGHLMYYSEQKRKEIIYDLICKQILYLQEWARNGHVMNNIDDPKFGVTDNSDPLLVLYYDKIVK